MMIRVWVLGASAVPNGGASCLPTYCVVIHEIVLRCPLPFPRYKNIRSYGSAL